MALPSPRPGRTCLVTGASSGIGAELARIMAARGYGLVLVARREERLRPLADELATGRDVRVEVLAADLADADQRSELASAVDRLGLSVGVLVNNAGFTTLGAVHRARRGGELALVRTDVEAVVDLCTLFVPYMVEQRQGAVLNVASTAAYLPLPGQAAYGASKAFVLSYTQALRAEVRRFGISVTALCPGPVATGFAAAAGATDHELLGRLPNMLWVAAREVARAGVEGVERDRAVVIPGLANRLGSLACTLVPRGLTAGVLAAVHPALRGRQGTDDERTDRPAQVASGGRSRPSS